VIEDPTWTPPEPTISRLTEKPLPITDPSDSESEDKPGLAKGSIIVITCVVILGLITVIAAIVGLSFHLYKKQAKAKQDKAGRNYRPDKPGVRKDDASVAQAQTERKLKGNENDLFPADRQKMHEIPDRKDSLRASVDQIPDERQ